MSTTGALLVAISTLQLATVAAGVVVISGPDEEGGDLLIKEHDQREPISRGDPANLDFLDTSLLLDPRLKDLYQVRIFIFNILPIHWDQFRMN